jgi:hypothetical protein
MSKRTLTVPLEITLYEPDRDDQGRITASTMFLLVGGGTYRHNGKTHPYGDVGTGLAAYLPGEYAVTINVRQIIAAGLAAIEDPDSMSEASQIL